MIKENQNAEFYNSNSKRKLRINYEDDRKVNERRRKDGVGFESQIQRKCFKTKMCSFFLEGKCNKIDNCSFAHTDVELHVKPDLKKTRLCVAFQQGRCSKPAEQCDFAHGQADLKLPSSVPQPNVYSYHQPQAAALTTHNEPNRLFKDTEQPAAAEMARGNQFASPATNISVKPPHAPARSDSVPGHPPHTPSRIRSFRADSMEKPHSHYSTPNYPREPNRDSNRGLPMRPQYDHAIGLASPIIGAQLDLNGMGYRSHEMPLISPSFPLAEDFQDENITMSPNHFATNNLRPHAASWNQSADIYSAGSYMMQQPSLGMYQPQSSFGQSAYAVSSDPHAGALRRQRFQSDYNRMASLTEFVDFY